MTAPLNRNSILWAIGVMQPVSIVELHAYLASVFRGVNSLPEENLLHQLIMEEIKSGLLIRISRSPDLFSLTLKGHHALTKSQRKVRDRERIFLLRASWSGRLTMSREMLTSSLDGDSPSLTLRTNLEGSEARATGPSVPQARSPWPRHSKQLFDTTGSSSVSRDSYIQLLSFNSPQQLTVARGEKDHPWADFISIGLMIGISPQLVLQIYARPDRHYRSFTIPKKNGSFRKIEAPRVFLKTIQKFIADYLMRKARIHDTVHSFVSGRSIITNAAEHVGKRWVVNLDIIEFFNSIKVGAVNNLFLSLGFDFTSARVLAALTTYMGRLPQGSPASPIISNALLYEFDSFICITCSSMSLSYTRYSDDITISGNDLRSIRRVVALAKHRIHADFGLQLNDDKERIISKNGQQRVTGVVVNNKVMPPRKFRRTVRAALHNASISDGVNQQRMDQLKGYVSYFQSYPEFNKTLEFKNLKIALDMVMRKVL